MDTPIRQIGGLVKRTLRDVQVALWRRGKAGYALACACLLILGAVTPLHAQTVTADAVDPASGTGGTQEPQKFTLTYSDTAGANALTLVSVLFHTTDQNTVNACYVGVAPEQGKVAVVYDAGAGTGSTVGDLGSGGTVQNSSCKVYLDADTNVSRNANTLTLHLKIQFGTNFAGAKTIYMSAEGSSPAIPWQARGTWTVPGLPFSADSVSPLSGTGTEQTFTLTFTHTVAATNLSIVTALFHTQSGALANSCYVGLAVGEDKVALVNDSGVGSTIANRTDPGVLQNSQCEVRLGGKTTRTFAGTTLTLNLAMTFKTGFAGAKTVFLSASSGADATGFQTRGAWTVPPVALSTGPVDPSGGTGQHQAFDLSYTSTAGVPDLTQVYALFHTTTDSLASSCYVGYRPGDETVLLANDAGNAVTSANRASTATLQNSQCRIALGGFTTVSTANNTLTLHLDVTFLPAFAGAKTIYQWAASAIQATEWHAAGTWTASSSVPTVSGLSPVTGPIDTVVTIHGTLLGTPGTVSFNGVPATWTEWTPSLITARVPAGATTGPVFVQVAGVPIGGLPFTVTEEWSEGEWQPTGVSAPPSMSTAVYYHLDAIGSVRIVTNQGGGLVARHDYSAFGIEIQQSGDSSRLRFAGKERDVETGTTSSGPLDYFGARYYASQTGRFTTADPSDPVKIARTASAAGVPSEIGGSLLYARLENPQRWNRYSYALNNPMRLVDPFGQEPQGHHLIAARGALTGMAREFANFVRTGPLQDNYPNQPGFNTLHREYNAAIEEALQEFEQTFGQSRNAWTLSQWRAAAAGILNSGARPIRDFIDLLDRNNGGRVIPALAAAIKAYEPSTLLKASYLAEGLGYLILRAPLIIIVNPEILTPHVSTSYCIGKGCETSQ
jgi:RHS repeat-associated protein